MLPPLRRTSSMDQNAWIKIHASEREIEIGSKQTPERAESLLEPGQRPVQSRCNGSGRASQSVRDLLIGEVFDILHHDDRSQLRGQTHYRLSNYFAALMLQVTDIRRWSGIKFLLSAQNRLERHILSPAPPLLIQAFVKRDSVDPGRQARLKPKSAQSTLNFQENRLQQVFRGKRVSERVISQRVDPIAIEIIEPLERAPVSALGVPHQLALTGICFGISYFHFSGPVLVSRQIRAIFRFGQ